MKQILISILAILLATSMFAQAPQAFNYQGAARDLSGNPISNQNVGLQITVLEESENGTEVYMETHNTTTTYLGLFNLQIGTGTVINGAFETIEWGNNSHFLQIAIDENGGTNYEIIGSSELLSVPYALNASNGSKWEENNNGIHFNSGNVGIGNENPEYPLDINYDDTSSLQFRNNENIQNNGTQLLVGHSNNGFSGIYLDAKEGDFMGNDYSFIKRVNDEKLEINNLDPVPIEFLTNNTFRMKIDEKGYVGIGTQEPQSKLHVAETTDAVIRLEADINDQNEEYNPRIEFVHDGGYQNSAIGLNLLENGIENGMYIANTTSARGGIYLATDDTANTWTSAMIRMTVATNGNIGIGAIEPKSKLQVTGGDIYIEDISSGVIMTSPNGQCWRMTVNNAGQPEFNTISCPN